MWTQHINSDNLSSSWVNSTLRLIFRRIAIMIFRYPLLKKDRELVFKVKYTWEMMISGATHFATYSLKFKNQINHTLMVFESTPPSKTLPPMGGRDSSWLSVFSAWFLSAPWIFSDLFNAYTSSYYYYCTWWLSREALLSFCWEE